MKIIKNTYSSACGAYAGLLDHCGKLRARDAAYNAAPDRSKCGDAFDYVADWSVHWHFTKAAFMSAWEGLIDWRDFWHVALKRRG